MTYILCTCTKLPRNFHGQNAEHTVHMFTSEVAMVMNQLVFLFEPDSYPLIFVKSIDCYQSLSDSVSTNVVKLGRACSSNVIAA